MAATRSWLMHGTIGALGLLYAWSISHTSYVTTGVQFVSPLAVIMVLHLAWLGACDRLATGFASVVIDRTLTTAIGVCSTTILLACVLPQPTAAAGLGDVLSGILTVVMCLTVLALVLLVAAVLLKALALLVNAVFALLRQIFGGRPPGAGGSRLHDLGVVVAALLAVVVASLEGLVGAFSFDASERAWTRVAVAASPARVWREVGKATSPDFPLPAMLHAIPRPVAIVTDEGASLGARRIVRFRGREGEGDLVLHVARRTDEEAVFEAISDTSPIAMWVRQKSITFQVTPMPAGALLTVSLDYDRRLTPAWFFRPFVGVAAYLAIGVLARDTQQRAEVQ